MTGNEGPAGAAARQQATATGFARVFQAAGDLVVYEGGEPYRLASWPVAAPGGGPAAPDPTGEQGRRQPSVLLRAGNAVVRFAGRTAEREWLRNWRDGEDTMAVCLLHAPGGQGKTRLAFQLAQEWQAQGWVVLGAFHHRERQAPQAFAVPVGLAEAAGVVVLVDYAERWDTADLLTLLGDTHLGAGRGIRVRVLLLARPAGAWWQSLSHRIHQDVGVPATRYELRPLEHDPGVSRVALFTAARDRFADLLGVPAAKAAEPPGELATHADYRLVLAVHMAALAAVLSTGLPGAAPGDPVDVSAFLLARERVHWQALHDRTEDRLATSPDAMAQLVYTATLTGPVDREDGTAAVERVGVESERAPGQLLKDHARCYPAPSADPPTTGQGRPMGAAAVTVLEPLYPDRLGEDFLALLTPGHAYEHAVDDWTARAPARLLLPAAPRTPQPGRSEPHPAWSRHALTTLIEAAGRWEHLAREQLHPLLRAHPGLALQAGGSALATLAGHPDVDLEVLAAIDDLLPERHVELDIAAAAIATRLADHRLAAADPVGQAGIHDRLAVRLANAGQSDPALAANERSLHGWRRLADSNRGYLPALARVTNNRSFLLRQAGRLKEALVCSEQSLGAYGEVVGPDREVALPWIATALVNHAALLSEAGRRVDALAFSERAVGAYRVLAGADRGVHLPNLAVAVNNHALRLAEARRPAEALAFSEEAVAAYRALVDVDRGVHLPTLAAVVNNHAVRLAEAGRPAEALAVTAEAVGTQRELAALNPAVHRPTLAIALANHAVRLAEAGRPAEALAVSAEAVGTQRELAALNPAAHRPNLATALANHAGRLAKADRPAEALVLSAEAVAVRRELAGADPGPHLPYLVIVLANHAGQLVDAGRSAEALVFSAEAVAVQRELVAPDPAAHLPNLVTVLANHIVWLSGAGRQAEALAFSEESVEAYRDLARRNSADHLPSLADALEDRLVRLADADRLTDSLALAEEAVHVRRLLAGADPATHRPAYLQSLVVLGLARLQNARFGEAVVPLVEALVIARDLPGHHEDLVRTIPGLLRRARAEDRAAVDERFRSLTGRGFPEWMR
ncbi:tetratricopeptide repeat protein [Kitasatospora sp. NPDC057015]|uniref:tetratricopeptide repeat protein n=1 Tax=Kitasatospora sp. NPDC057015 TaxID=3346001 RepID=UPI003635AA4D